MDAIKERRVLDNMPYDHIFPVGPIDGCDMELCHATGDEVLFEGDDDFPWNWWNEYVDLDGNFHYGR